MDIKQLRYFDAIVKHGKISWAANALFISQPSLSMSLSKLEEELGFRLLERNDGMFKLTDSGGEFYHHVKLVLSIYGNMEDEVRYIRKKGRGKLKVGITETFRMVTPELFEIYLDIYNDLDIQLTEGTTTHIINQVRTHQLHFGLTTLNYKEDGMESNFLGQNVYSVLVHTDFPLEIAKLEELSAYTLIFIENSSVLNKFLQENNLKFRNIIRVDTIGTAVRLVKKDLGFAVIPEFYAKNYTDDDVKSINLQHDLKSPDLYLSFMKDRHFSPVIEDCIKMTREYLLV